MPTSLSAVDKLAGDNGVNVAIAIDGDPKSVMSAIEGLSPHVGVSVSFGNWIEQGIRPVDGLAMIKDRLMVVRLRDRNVLGANGRDVPLGTGVAEAQKFLLEVAKQEPAAAGGAEQMRQLQPSIRGNQAPLYRAGRRSVAGDHRNRATAWHIAGRIRRTVAAGRRL